MACRISSGKSGAGLSSTSFWWRRCAEQSRSPSQSVVPWVSAMICISTCLGHAGVGGLLRTGRVLCRAVPGMAEARRDADHRRYPRHHALARRARLLGTAPPPEAGRGEPGTGLPRRDPARYGRSSGEGGRGLWLCQRGDRGVPLPGRRVLLPRDEHPPAGRASGDRVGDRSRPGRMAAAGGLGRAARIRPGRRPPGRARHRDPDQRGEPGGRGILALAGHHLPFRRPGGPGVRLDTGYESGDTVSQFYDNLVAKLLVWGHDREAARHRMLRAIDETVIEGVATTLPADIAILTNPDFISARHSTNWVEQTLDLSGVTSTTAGVPPAPAADGDHHVPKVLRDVTAEVDGRRYQVKLWVPDLGEVVAAPGGHAGPARGAGPKRPRAAASGVGSGTVAVPMQGTIVKVLIAVGDAVEVGQTVCVLEAMKMENNVNAEKVGTVKEVKVSAGDSVGPGDVIAVID